MRNLEDFLKPTQKKLFNLLSRKYWSKALINEGGYILVPGEAPVMLLAHLDTVHEKPVKHICIDGAGYDFYEAHWIPLYNKRGLK